MLGCIFNEPCAGFRGVIDLGDLSMDRREDWEGVAVFPARHGRFMPGQIPPPQNTPSTHPTGQ